MPDLSKLKVGIIGSGQLARMICEVRSKLHPDLDIQILASSPQDSACRVHTNFRVGNVANEKDLREFFNEKTHVLFENEFLDTELLRQASRALKIQFVPNLPVLEVAQDKLRQKVVFEQCGLASARYKVFSGLANFDLVSDSKTDVGVAAFVSWAKEVLLSWPVGAAFKWSRMGYDGKGTLLVRKEASVEELSLFYEGAIKNRAQIYAEELLPFKRELAMVGARNEEGEFYSFPLVASIQEKGICKWVLGPAESLFSVHLETEAQKSLKKVGESLNIVGVFALEFFEVDSSNYPSRLLINELAPRVHNTGHYTQNASSPSQFELHLRASLGSEVPSLKTAPYFAMLNLLGPQLLKEHESSSLKMLISAKMNDLALSSKDFQLHWYDKPARPRRKLGHINFTANEKNKFDQGINLLKTLESWWENLK